MDPIYDLFDATVDDVFSYTKKDGYLELNFGNVTIKLVLLQDSAKIGVIDEDNCDSIALVNILNRMFSNISIDSIYDIIVEGKMLYNNLKDYCIVCSEKLEYQSSKYVTCGSKKCCYKYEELLIDNPVLDYIKADSEITKFLLISAFDAIKCPRNKDIFEPFPQYFILDDTVNTNNNSNRGELSALSGNNYNYLKNFPRLIALIEQFNIDNFMENSVEYLDDRELMNDIGKDMYILIRFIILSCKVRIIKDDDLMRNFWTKNNDKSITIYKIIHPVDIEDNFNKIKCGNGDMLFHGSGWDNWYSIIRNGLKNCSGTDLMTGGDAYGSGIYLSTTSQYSYNYGNKGNISGAVIGVFEVGDNIKKYHKSGNIYVVTDEKILLQRYLILVKSTKFCDKIDNMFRKKINEESKETKTIIQGKGIKKLIREYKRIKKGDPEKLGFKVSPSGRNVYNWKVNIFGYDKNSDIGKDMANYGYTDIELEVKFPETYPFSPPFVRIISPRFMALTGHVTRAGALCMQILTESHWVSTCSIESLIVTIKAEILEGGGRLDPENHDKIYSESEAKESFIRVARGHGWL